ncbi:MAG: hypothetical protein LIP03_11240 [Bacteroidales bacterium]|nr:hypothetical protein [Bacteroidales bacterium]
MNVTDRTVTDNVLATKPVMNAETKVIPYIEPQGVAQEEILNYLLGKPSGITFIHGKAGCGKTV